MQKDNGEAKQKSQNTEKEILPKHVCIIPNGNRTWARREGLSDNDGHKAGVELLVEITRYMRTRGIHTASVWGSSTENFKRRSATEINNLINLLEYVMGTWAQEAHDEGARLIHLGRKDLLPKAIAKKIEMWEEKTKKNAKHVINLAFAYGGHDELFRAMEKAFADIEAGKIKFEDLKEETGIYNGKYPYHKFKDYLDTKDQPYPYPDLIIRSAGEDRLSGWMPWQSVYAEFYTVDLLFPEFTTDTIEEALQSYSKRNRKFGGN